MDGTGPSGVTLDWSKTQILWIDYEWLGVGLVRFGFVVDGKLYLAHEVKNTNATTLVYTSTPNLPLRYEISNDGNGAADSLTQICGTVISEGSQEPTGFTRAEENGFSSMANTATYALIGLKLKSTALDATIELKRITVVATSANDAFYWRVYLNPTVAGSFTYGDVSNSTVQTATGAVTNTITGGTVLDCGVASTAASGEVDLNSVIALGSKIDATRDEIVLAIAPITNNITVHGTLTWRETG